MSFDSSQSMDQLVEEVSRLVSRLAGIKLGSKQKNMVLSRLRSRMIKLGLDEPMSYRIFLEQNRDTETDVLVSLLTTHHSFFFREFVHFEHLKSMLPALEKRKKFGEKVRIWSAACSRGQEAYSLAIFLDYYISRMGLDLDYEIWGTDIDSESIGIARNGVFRKTDVSEVPIHFLSDYFSRGTGDISDFVMVNRDIRKKCHFGVLNLLELEGNSVGPFDFIFCRNLFIYFENETVSQCVDGLVKCLDREGCLYLGTSENINDNDHGLKNLGPSIYTTASKPVPVHRPSTLKVLCVDDSPSVLKIMEKIFGENDGYELIGTAANGVDALHMLQRLSPDVITLDIHMPVMDGIEFLEKYTGDCPVVVVSSIPRDDTETIGQLAKLGINDYVEKPSIVNFHKHSDEIRTKLKSAVEVKDRSLDIRKPLSLLQVERKEITVDKDIHFFLDRENFSRYIQILREIPVDYPPVYIWVDGEVDQVVSSLPERVQPLSRHTTDGMVSVGDIRKDLPLTVLSQNKKLKHLVIVGKNPSPDVVFVCKTMRSAYFVMEEDPYGELAYSQLLRIVDDVMPRSSFQELMKKWILEYYKELAS